MDVVWRSAALRSVRLEQISSRFARCGRPVLSGRRGLRGADGPSGGLLRQQYRRRPGVGGVDCRQLEAEGYQVVVQAWDFGPGRDWAHKMRQTTTTAERVVVVLSPAYLRSAHGEAEWRAFYAEDPR
jgi:TIR domain